MKPIGHALLAGLLCLLAGPALATDADRALLDGQLRNMPLDVATLADRERQCRGWLATQITDGATDHRVQHALTHLRCDALAAEVVVLRHKYAQSPQALRALDTAGDIDF
jgi:hypothetical protein